MGNASAMGGIEVREDSKPKTVLWLCRCRDTDQRGGTAAWGNAGVAGPSPNVRDRQRLPLQEG